MAFSRTRSTKARTTLKLTSASSRATRTSRSASWMLSSVSRPRLPSRSKMDCSLVLRESSMERRSLRNYAEDFNSPAGGAPASCRVRARSAKRADANPHGLPTEDLQHEAEGQDERGHGDPEVEAAPARLPLEPREPEDLQDSHSRLPTCPVAGAVPTRYMN